VNAAHPPGRREWLVAGALGAALGTVVLGVGGRLAMRGIALLQGQTPGFSLGGTVTVVLLGALSGLVAALGFIALRWVLRTRRLVRGALYWTLLVLVTLRGLRPIDVNRLILFLPLVIAYGTALQLLWCRIAPAKPGARRSTP
jgi:hypothetical protein